MPNAILNVKNDSFDFRFQFFPLSIGMHTCIKVLIIRENETKLNSLGNIRFKAAKPFVFIPTQSCFHSNTKLE